MYVQYKVASMLHLFAQKFHQKTRSKICLHHRGHLSKSFLLASKLTQLEKKGLDGAQVWQVFHLTSSWQAVNLRII